MYKKLVEIGGYLLAAVAIILGFTLRPQEPPTHAPIPSLSAGESKYDQLNVDELRKLIAERRDTLVTLRNNIESSREVSQDEDKNFSQLVQQLEQKITQDVKEYVASRKSQNSITIELPPLSQEEKDRNWQRSTGGFLNKAGVDEARQSEIRVALEENNKYVSQATSKLFSGEISGAEYERMVRGHDTRDILSKYLTYYQLEQFGVYEKNREETMTKYSVETQLATFAPGLSDESKNFVISTAAKALITDFDSSDLSRAQRVQKQIDALNATREKLSYQLSTEEMALVENYISYRNSLLSNLKARYETQ